MRSKFKYQEAVSYIQHRVPWISEEMIRWILFKADMVRYAESGYSITGVSWIKSERGPLPSFR